MPRSPTQWGASGSPTAVVNWLVGQLPVGRVINVGAGMTNCDSQGRTHIAVDLVIPATAGAPAHGPASAPGRFVCADAGELPFADHGFDAALCKDIIEHTVDPIAVLKEIHRVCIPGAAIIVTVPRAIPRAVWADPTHVRGFTDRAIVTALTMSGWAPVTRPRRLGGFPGAGRLKLENRLLDIMAIPGFGHWFGTNWYVKAVRE